MVKEIFIVEDNPDIREMLEYILTQDTYKVRSFSTAEEFKSLLASQTPDLVLMDIMLPDGNGLEICKSLRERPDTVDIPILVMSAHASGNARLFREKGATDFITKPFDVDDLLQRIHFHLN